MAASYDRWPLGFDPDDVDVERLDGEGVCVTHKPTGIRVVMNNLSTRDANTEVALRRLSREIRKDAGAG